MRVLWFALGLISLTMAIIGVVLPIMPTVPFLLLAALSFARSSRRMHRWIMMHPVYGPLIRNWQEKGAVSRRVKIIACLSMAAGFAVTVVIGLPAWILALQGAILSGAAAFLITRPE